MVRDPRLKAEGELLQAQKGADEGRRGWGKEREGLVAEPMLCWPLCVRAGSLSEAVKAK